MLESLGALERSFFDKLDLEVAKIEQFFVARELEARTRMSELKEQLHELRDHRKLFHVSFKMRYDVCDFINITSVHTFEHTPDMACSTACVA